MRKRKSAKLLRQAKKTADLALKKQAKEGLAKIFTKLRMKGVAREIKAGRNVTGNVEFGIRHGVHEKIGPRYNVKTKKFTPMSPKAKKMERKFVSLSNKLLVSGGYRKVRPTLIRQMRKGDKAFERKTKRRKR